MATPTQIKRRGRISLVLGTIIASVMLVAAAFGADLKADLSAADGIQQNKDLGNVVGGDSYPIAVTVYYQGGPDRVTSVTFDDNGTLPSFVSGVTGGTVTRSSGNGLSTTATSTITVVAPCTTGGFGGNDNGTKLAGSSVQYAVTAVNSGASTSDVGTSTAWVNIKGNVTSLGSNCTVTPPANVAPVIAWTANPSSANEGDTKTYTFSITDSDSSSWSFVTDYPDCGSLGSVSGTPSINPTTKVGTFTCSFPDGFTGASSTVKAKVTDATDASNELTQAVAIANLNPAVTAGFAATTVSCGASNASLNLSFTDAGVNDGPWAVVINWGDGTSNTSFNATSQGTQTAQSHTYATAAAYNATVTVTDKDSGVGQDLTNALTVNYTVTGVLQPVNNTQNGQIASVFKYKSTIPVKIQIQDCDLSYPAGLAPTISVWLASSSPPPAGDEEAASTVPPTSGNTLRFTGTPDNQYIYNAATKNLSDSSATYNLKIAIPGTGQTILASFGLKP